MAVGSPVGDALEGLCQPGVWIDAVHLGGGDCGPGPTTAIGSGEESIFSGDGLWPDGAFDDVGIDLDATIGTEALERCSAAKGIADVT